MICELIRLNKNVLIIDDDMRNVFALTKILSQHNMVVSRAENGKVALDMVKENPNFGVILMDIMMPEMEGYENIRKIPELIKIPIIALTAKVMKEDRRK